MPDDDKPISDEEKARIEEIRVEMHEYHKALEQEFETKSANKSENVIKSSLEHFEDNTQKAAQQIVWLMDHSSSDSTRLAASKYVIDRVYKGAVDGTEDPIKKILEKLMRGESTVDTEA
jgi:hypothetical protein